MINELTFLCKKTELQIQLNVCTACSRRKNGGAHRWDSLWILEVVEMELTPAGADYGGRWGSEMKGEPMMDERKLGMECVRRGKMWTQKVADIARHDETDTACYCNWQIGYNRRSHVQAVLQRNVFLNGPLAFSAVTPRTFGWGPSSQESCNLFVEPLFSSKEWRVCVCLHINNKITLVKIINSIHLRAVNVSRCYIKYVSIS